MERRSLFFGGLFPASGRGSRREAREQATEQATERGGGVSVFQEGIHPSYALPPAQPGFGLFGTLGKESPFTLPHAGLRAVAFDLFEVDRGMRGAVCQLPLSALAGQAVFTTYLGYAAFDADAPRGWCPPLLLPAPRWLHPALTAVRPGGPYGPNPPCACAAGEMSGGVRN